MTDGRKQDHKPTEDLSRGADLCFLLFGEKRTFCKAVSLTGTGWNDKIALYNFIKGSGASGISGSAEDNRETGARPVRSRHCNRGVQNNWGNPPLSDREGLFCMGMRESGNLPDAGTGFGPDHEVLVVPFRPQEGRISRAFLLIKRCFLFSGKCAFPLLTEGSPEIVLNHPEREAERENVIMKMKRIIPAVLLAALSMTGVLTACGSTEETETVEETSSTEAVSEVSGETSEQEDTEEKEDEENYDTGDASRDDPLNQDEIGEQELLVVSFGTSYNDSRRLTIGAIESALQEAYPEWSVRRAFTSQIIIDHIAERDEIRIDNVKEALDRAVDNGVKKLVVQPTHLMSGLEYNDLVDEIGNYSDAFEQVEIGDPLFGTDGDMTLVAETLVDATSEYDDGETAIVFMGHGTEAESNGVYAKMQTIFEDLQMENYYVGTVEAEPSLQDVIDALKEKEYKKVVLQPMMVVAGDHANNDMAGDEEDSWKSVLTEEGYEVTCVLEGLGQNGKIQQIYVEHAKDAIDRMNAGE